MKTIKLNNHFKGNQADKFKGKFLSDKSSLRLREFWGSKEDLQKGFDINNRRL
mgnify:CR=1 FL=1